MRVQLSLPLVVVTVALAVTACVRPSNPFDPDAPDGIRAKGRLKGKVALLREQDAEAPGRGIELVTDDGTVKRTKDDGTFEIEVKDGIRSVTASAERYHDASCAPVLVTPGDVVNVGTITLVDATVPAPMLVDAPPSIINTTELGLELRAAPSNPNDNYNHAVVSVDGVVASPRFDDVDPLRMYIDLVPDAVQLVVLRAVDDVGNVSDAVSFIVEVDQVPPPVPTLTATPGNARADLAWTTDDAVASVIEYGDAADLFNGVSANEGSSPVAVGAVSNKRLSGLVNGHTLFARVRVLDAAGNESASAPIAITPAEVTPTFANGDGIALASPAVAQTTDGRFVFVVEESGAIAVTDAALASTAPAIEYPALVPGATDAKMFGRYLIVTAPEGIYAVDTLRPDALAVVGSSLIEDEWGSCAGGACACVGLDVVDGVATVVARSVIGSNAGGVWHVDLVNLVEGGEPTLQSSPIGNGFEATLVGPVRVFGTRLAVGVLDPNGTSNAAVLILQNGFGEAAQPCAEYVPRNDGSFVEQFIGEGIINPEPLPRGRAAFDVVGHTLFAAFDGSAVAFDIDGGITGGLANDCFDAFQNGGLPTVYSTATRAIGVARLGILTARSVTSAGGYLYVASRQRSTALAAQDRIDVVSFAQRQATVGASAGFVQELEVVGRIDVRSGPAPIVRGGTITVADDAVRHIRVFDAAAPVFTAAVGENPTGAVVGMGFYVVHQRTDRGVTMWDVADPSSPQLAQPQDRCVPGCFTGQQLAGDVFLEGGLLHGAMSLEGDTAVFVTDVSTLLDDARVVHEYANPCSSGDALGFTHLGDRAFVGCASQPEVHIGSFHHAVNTALDFDERAGLDGATLPAPIRSLVVARTGSGANATHALFVLDDTGALSAFDLALYTGSASPVVLGASAPDLGWTSGRRLSADGDRLYALGAIDNVDCDADPNTPGETETQLAVIDLVTLDVVDQVRMSCGGAEPTQTLAPYPDVVVVGRNTADARYDLRERDGSARAVATPNSFTVDAAIVGGHLFTAAMSVFALE